MRFWRGELAIGLIDLTIALVMLAVCIYVYRSRKIGIANLALAVFSSLAAVMSIYIMGASQVYWLYPAILASYYLVQPIQALIISIGANLLALSLIFGTIDILTFSAIFTTQLITNLFAFVFSKNMHEKHASLADQANRDPLTLAGNRRALDIKLAEIGNIQNRQPQQVSLIIFDLDHFKAINDQYGHRVGDQVLIKVVDLIQSRIRVTDSLYRFGGEEFVIVPLSIRLADAYHLAEELRQLVESSTFAKNIQATISLGVAEFRAGETPIEWLERADKALYRAKGLGRNQSCEAA